MAVPLSCLNVMSPNEKMLFSITSLSAAINASFCLGRTSATFFRIPLLAIDPVRINKKNFDRNEHERIL